MKAKAALFDLDGTLTDSAEGIVRSAGYALEKLGIREEDPARLRRFIGPPLRSAFRDFYAVDEAKLDQAVAWYREYYVPRGMYENALYPGIPDMLDALRGGGLELYIATSKPQPMAERIAAYFGIDRYFEAIVGARMDETRSEKDKVIRHLIRTRRGGRKEGLVMVGDRMYDMEGAAAAGIPAIGAAWGYGGREELTASGAAAIADSPRALCRLLLEEGI